MPFRLTLDEILILNRYQIDRRIVKDGGDKSLIEREDQKTLSEGF